jgi:hypothetical protein
VARDWLGPAVLRAVAELRTGRARKPVRPATSPGTAAAARDDDARAGDVK